jgi:hypothetical protein
MSFRWPSILLSASVPNINRNEKYLKEYPRIKDAQIQIEEAVISLCRNLFQAGGRIVFGGHPSISPLVKMVATEFDISKEVENTKRNERGEKLIHIYQSRAYEKVIREAKNKFDSDYFEVIWTDNRNDEYFDPSITGRPQCEESLAYMRAKMVNEKLDAMVCIGGMDGVEGEFELFQKVHSGKPIYLLESTGGATKILADSYARFDHINVIDRATYKITEKRKDEKEDQPKFKIIPYTFITALIIEDISRR